MAISFADAVVTAVLGYSVVFGGLIALMAVIVVFGKVMSSKNKK